MDLVIVCFIEKPLKDLFHSSEWPLHMTLVPPFSYSGDINTLNELLEKYAEETSEFGVISNKRTLLGPDKDIPVTLVELNEELQQNYINLLNVLKSLDFKYKQPLISGLNYIFHITDQNGVKAPVGKLLPITSFSLINRSLNGQKGFKQIMHTFHLTENKLQ